MIEVTLYFCPSFYNSWRESENVHFTKLALCQGNCQNVNRITFKSEWISSLYRQPKGIDSTVSSAPSSSAHSAFTASLNHLSLEITYQQTRRDANFTYKFLKVWVGVFFCLFVLFGCIAFFFFKCLKLFRQSKAKPLYISSTNLKQWFYLQVF